MDFNLKTGIPGSESLIVSIADTATHYGSGLIEVFATPAMIGLMEKTAQLSIQHLLPDGFITLGTEVNVTHVKATPLGMKVSSTSELIGVDGKKLLFKVSAHDESGLIGEGTHKRYIVNAAEFMQKLKSGK
ncbi:MAG: thioesterase superfamily [Bacteroidetes bacterium]|nr:MAG: thioesterase superfamily [Bacteroidota bacterium]